MIFYKTSSISNHYIVNLCQGSNVTKRKQVVLEYAKSINQFKSYIPNISRMLLTILSKMNVLSLWILVSSSIILAHFALCNCTAFIYAYDTLKLKEAWPDQTQK